MNCNANASGEQLESAFLLFNQLSEKLAQSYGELELRVTQLSQELAEARNERHKQLAEKEILAARLEGLLDALPAGVVVLDADGLINQANPRAHQMLGDTLVGQSWIRVASSALITQGDALQLRDGRRVSVAGTALLAEPGKIILITDISETCALQEKLSRQQRLTSLGEMLASLAHQIRTPVATALLYLSNIKHPNANITHRARFVDRASERLQHLEHMLNDMLVFARGDVAAAEYFSVNELIEQCLHQLEPILRSAGAVLTINNEVPEAMLKGNRDALQGAFQNLLLNAIEACTDIPKLGISISRTYQNTLQFEFNDNGCGMEQAVISRILEPFYTTRSNGTGLGLAVVNATVASHGGHLEMSSSKGIGSCFTIRLPQAACQDALASRLAAADIAEHCVDSTLLLKQRPNNVFQVKKGVSV
jgi:two-component system sensor histidine kinase FlrB